MPTTRQRYSLTETEDLAAALREAARRWPGDATSPSRLLLRLIEAGRAVVAGDAQSLRARRLAAVEGTHGQFRGVYDPGYLERLRAEWPG